MPETNNTQLAIEESLPRLTRPETDEEAMVRRHHEHELETMLTSLDPSDTDSNFESRDTVELHVKRGGKMRVIRLPIKSIPARTMAQINSSESYPRLPVKRNAETGEYEDDVDAPDYLDKALKFREALTRTRFRKIVHGLEMDIKSVDGKSIVWKHDGGPEERDEQEAMNSLHALRFSDEHILQIVTAIEQLSSDVQGSEQEDLEKKS